MENKDEIQVQVKISSIEILKFFFISIDKIENQKLEYNTNFSIKVFDNSDEIGIFSSVKIRITEQDNHFVELETLLKFGLKPFSDIIRKKDDNSYQISDALMVNLTDIVIGTIRGILFEKLRGTLPQSEIFPLVNAQQLVKSQNATK